MSINRKLAHRNTFLLSQEPWGFLVTENSYIFRWARLYDLEFKLDLYFAFQKKFKTQL
jgi:hypothetical protein